MGLFQRSVLSKFLKQQDKDAVAKAYKKFSKHFHNAHIQVNIRNSKEEQYQEGFLRELFVDVFGYTLNPQPKYNLTTELKNEKGAKKADGAILKDGNALGVIELKGTDTKDLEKVRQQAFDYKANQTGCVYVITSNFEKLRFYINNAVEWEEFDLFTINEQRFELLYLCLAADNLLNNVPLGIKEASIAEEENITKKFYADYSLFKRELFRNLVKENMRNEVYRNVLAGEESVSRADKNIKLSLFKKSQKLIDRFLFIFFAEDRGLLPPNSTLQILDEYDKLKALDAHVPLYNRFKLYFNYLDQGRKGTSDKAEIFAYNGGLFKPDTTLDSLLIDDELLYRHAKTLAKYDFESQVDVNILGHIFENSLNEIESVNAEIEGVDFDKQKTKRKKDGVFYTPKYITKYIVDNTVGKLCQEKKAELGIIDEEYTSNRQKDTKRKLLDKLENYRAWLLEITICDPACGSGAFLNQALDFLINEHRAIDELQASLLGGGLLFPDVENTILENNIYGVDLNEESVEIAKLSLWLRTAQPRRKLNDLNNNIKCGNSLIDSKAVAGDKAFNWEKEFPEVFAKGGFDVVIGNPPYGAHISKQDQEFYIKKYETPKYKLDTYGIFIEKGFGILNRDGFLGYIVPYTWLTIGQHSTLRQFLLNYRVIEIIDLPTKIFADADLDTVILNAQKCTPVESIKVGHSIKNEIIVSGEISLNNIKNNDDLLINIQITESDVKIIDKLRLNAPLDLQFEVSQGYIPYRRSDLIKEYGEIEGNKIVDERLWHSNTKQGDEWKQEIQGRDLSRYGNSESFQYIKYGKHLAGYVAEKFFQNPRVLIMEVTRGSKYKISSTYLTKEYYNTPSIINVIEKNNDTDKIKYLLGILNSRLITWYHTKVHPKANAVTSIPKILVKDVRQLPLPNLMPINSEFVRLVEDNLRYNELLNSHQNKFIEFLCKTFRQENFTTKIKTWFSLDYSEFIKELNNAKKKSLGKQLSKVEEMEWMEVFETKKKEALELKANIEKTDKEIDQMVYELYGLSEEEIKIVEEA